MIKLETFSFIDYIFNSVLQFGGALHFLFVRSTRFFEQFYVTSLINSFITLTPTMYVVLCQLTRNRISHRDYSAVVVHRFCCALNLP